MQGNAQKNMKNYMGNQKRGQNKYLKRQKMEYKNVVFPVEIV